MTLEFLKNLVRRRHDDQWAYLVAGNEIRKGIIREGLMIKAVAHSDGDAVKAKTIYFRFLAEEIAEDEAKQRFKESLLKTREDTATVTSALLESSKEASGKVFEVVHGWGSAFVKNVLIGGGCAFFLAVLILHNKYDPNTPILSYFFSNILSAGFLGELLAYVIFISIIFTPLLAILLFIPFIRQNDIVALLIVAVPVCIFVVSQWQGTEVLKHYEAQKNWGRSPAIPAASAKAAIPDTPEVGVRFPPPSERKIREQEPTSQPKCQFKRVMKDADYRACGLEPPRS